MSTYRTKSGRILTDADIEALADEAERGYMIDDEQPKFSVNASGGVGHGINTYKRCPKCNGTNFEVRNYDEMWRDGDVYCVDCNAFVREYDAG